MEAILGYATHESRQTVLFSATVPDWVHEVAAKLMAPNPKLVDLVGDTDVKASSDVRHVAVASPGPINARAGTINDVIAMYCTQARTRLHSVSAVRATARWSVHRPRNPVPRGPPRAGRPRDRFLRDESGV